MRLQYTLFNYPTCATCFAHLTLLDLIVLTLLGDQYKLCLSSQLLVDLRRKNKDWVCKHAFENAFFAVLYTTLAFMFMFIYKPVLR